MGKHMFKECQSSSEKSVRSAKKFCHPDLCQQPPQRESTVLFHGVGGLENKMVYSPDLPVHYASEINITCKVKELRPFLVSKKKKSLALLWRQPCASIIPVCPNIVLSVSSRLHRTLREYLQELLARLASQALLPPLFFSSKGWQS